MTASSVWIPCAVGAERRLPFSPGFPRNQRLQDHFSFPTQNLSICPTSWTFWKDLQGKKCPPGSEQWCLQPSTLLQTMAARDAVYKELMICSPCPRAPQHPVPVLGVTAGRCPTRYPLQRCLWTGCLEFV